MENLRLYGCALTNGSNNLTNKLSVTALKRLLPVFLMMIFLGIGTDVLGRQNNKKLKLCFNNRLKKSVIRTLYMHYKFFE